MEFVKFLSYTIPLHGNRRSIPYGKIVVIHNGEERVVRFGKMDGDGRSYITFNRKRYYYNNAGSLYSPKFLFETGIDNGSTPIPAPACKTDISKKEARLSDLLNLLVDQMIADANNRNLPVIRKLLKMGFTPDELMLVLNFPITEVEECLPDDSVA